jgi:histidinol phosphatase-like PHP family hydrolase
MTEMRDDLDLHIHTARVGCANDTMAVPSLLARCEQLGRTHIAITDHLNGPQHLEAQEAIREDLADYDGPVAITWGMEATIADAESGALTVTEEHVERFGYDFVIAGPHGRYHETEPEAIIAINHRLMLATVRNPIVDALVHPWWFSRVEWERALMTWFDDMSRIPRWHVEELAEACVETGTSVEMNGGAIIQHQRYTDRFKDDYREYLSQLSERGVTFTLCSDAHDIEQLDYATDAAQFLADAGVPDGQIEAPVVSEV